MVHTPAANHASAIVIVSADREWQEVRALFPITEALPTPYGAWFAAKVPSRLDKGAVIFFQGGWGKIAAAASTQYAIARWQPDLLINLGTCGGLVGAAVPGDVILATRTIVYDILEQMGDPEAALAHYRTEIDLTWLGESDPYPVRRVPLVSADRDLVAAEVTDLAARHGAVAGDWESGAIAWVAARHGTRCLILRGVTDLVSDTGGDAYDGALQEWSDATGPVMRALVEQLPAWLDRAAKPLVGDLDAT